MKIRDISIAEVRQGLNWRLVKTNGEAWWEKPMEEWNIEPATPLRAKDHAVYSAVYVLENGEVDPVLIVRDVSSRTPGGDYAEFVDGHWRQLGLVPNPNAIPGTEYIATPHPNDRSFTANERELQSEMFARFVGRMRGG
jgi:hypothetical protein